MTNSAENDAPTCRRCYAETLTQGERERFYAEPVTSCVYLCPEHQVAYDRIAASIDWSVIVKATRRADARVFPPGHALMDGPTCECGLRLGGHEGTVRDWHAQHLAEHVSPPAEPVCADCGRRIAGDVTGWLDTDEWRQSRLCVPCLWGPPDA